MDVDEYREYLRNRLLLLVFLAVVVLAARWTGLLESSTSSGMAGRAYAIQFLALVIVVGWVVVAVIGLIGLVRWVRAE